MSKVQQGSLMVEVVRYHFFERPRQQTLRYSEHSPEAIHEEGNICNCTKSVAKRPEGIPGFVSQEITLKQNAGRYRFDLRLQGKLAEEGSDGPPWFTFRWGEEHPDPMQRWKTPHAYFMSDVNGVKNSLKIEIALPGYGRTGYFFGHLYFGNQIDISQFYNGHSPSKIVNLARIGTNAVWAHDCGLGREGMEFLRECEETEKWRQIKQWIDEIERLATRYNNDRSLSVDEVRSGVERNQVLLSHVTNSMAWFLAVLDNLKDTELFRACDKANRMSHSVRPEQN